jgi:hypothetical protein
MSIDLARQLRHEGTETEKRVWHLLRSRQTGAKFRRQQPIEGYFVTALRTVPVPSPSHAISVGPALSRKGRGERSAP